MTVRINSCIHYICASDWSFHRHWDDHTLWYVTAGGCSIRQGPSEFQCYPDSAYVFGPNRDYTGTYLADQKLSVFVIHFDCPSDVLSLQINRKYTPASSLLVRDQLQRLLRQTTLGNAGAAVDWLQTILRTLNEDNGFLRSQDGALADHAQAINRICQDVADAPEVPYRIDDMARDMFLSPDHFRRVFKQRIGITPKAWIIQCRIQKAKGLLLSSSYTIERISELCGFQNVFFFSRQFKKKAGISPSAYRR